MVRRKLLIITESYRRKKLPKGLIPAIERYDGVFFRVLKSLERRNKLKNVDILIVSATFGLLYPESKVPYYEPHRGAFGSLPRERISFEFKKDVLSKLQKQLRQKEYLEIYVNVGKQYRELIEGFEKITDANIIYAEGPGIGPKAAHMKKWILSQ